MINHHPTHELLSQFVHGQLSVSVSAAIAIHTDLCPHCQQAINEITQQQANKCFTDTELHPTDFEETFLHKFQVDSSFPGSNDTDNDLKQPIDFDDLINAITDDDDIDEPSSYQAKNIEVKGVEYQLPRALNHIELGHWSGIGKLSRARLQLDEGRVHSSLLQIQPGGSVPNHTHKGMELTLLLDGSFEDEMGRYQKGDFIWLTGEHNHHPVSKEGCLCLTVSDDSLVFTDGIAKALNPIGSFIY